jgi:hypothetical protein
MTGLEGENLRRVTRSVLVMWNSLDPQGNPREKVPGNEIYQKKKISGKKNKIPKKNLSHFFLQQGKNMLPFF